MRVLVTGATGFIGRALVAQLGTQGHTVVAATRRQIARSTEPSLPHVQWVQVGDIGRLTHWHQALQDVDVVVHLAARVHVMKEKAADPLALFREVNVEGSRCLAEQAAKAGVKRLVYLSSVKVHGESTPMDQPWTEEDEPHPQDAYGISKLEAERAVTAVAGQHAMSWTIIRPPLVYGPGVGANFKALMRVVRRGIPLPLGAIHNRRSLVALDNLTDCIALCLHHPMAANQHFMVSDQHDLSTPTLIRELANALQRSPRLITVPAPWLVAAGKLVGREAAVQRLCSNLQVDSNKLSHRLGWKPPLTVTQALQQTVSSFQKEH